MERRIIIAGTRTFSDYELLRKVMSQTFGSLSMQEIREMKIVSGGCQGADMIGETFAHNNGLICVRFPANWNLYGKKAGPIRNEEMAKYASETYGILIAFWDGKSRGTKNMIDTAKETWPGNPYCSNLSCPLLGSFFYHNPQRRLHLNL